MPAKDIYHDTVKRALEKDGLMITARPDINQIHKTDEKKALAIK